MKIEFIFYIKFQGSGHGKECKTGITNHANNRKPIQGFHFKISDSEYIEYILVEKHIKLFFLTRTLMLHVFPICNLNLKL